jgi:hypothetical protein
MPLGSGFFFLPPLLPCPDELACTGAGASDGGLGCLLVRVSRAPSAEEADSVLGVRSRASYEGLYDWAFPTGDDG